MKTVYSQDGCKGCEYLLKSYALDGLLEGQDFKVVKVGVDISLEDFLKTFPGIRHVPYVVE